MARVCNNIFFILFLYPAFGSVWRLEFNKNLIFLLNDGTIRLLAGWETFYFHILKLRFMQLVERVLMGYKFGPCEHKAIVDKFSAVNILQASSIINFLFTDKNIREKVIKLPALLFLVI